MWSESLLQKNLSVNILPIFKKALVLKSQLTKTYSGHVVPVIGYATKIYNYDRNGEYSSPLTVWKTETEAETLLELNVCQNQVSGIHFGLLESELWQSPKTLCFISLHQTKYFLPFLEL